MYLSNGGRYYGRDGGQCARRGAFLLMMQPDTRDPMGDCGKRIRCVVRKVALRQCGHWMMGTARIGSRWYTVSGAYGHDGLPMAVQADAYERGIELPQELRDAWNVGGGWNGCGSEAAAIREWAIANLEALTA